MDTQQAISADSHVDLPWLPDDIFKEAAPQALRDRVPTLTDTPSGRQWTYPGRPWMGGAAGPSAHSVFEWLWQWILSVPAA